ncbi:aegerolysin family protein [Pleurotus pulmonarius]|nr:Ostreolysin A6 [Pleurotus pulmonarius]
MADARFVIIVLNNVGSKDVKIKNLTRTWGKLHADGDQDAEVGLNEYEGVIVKPNTKVQINACARHNAPKGTTGSFDLVDPADGDGLIRSFYWNCAGENPTNTWDVTGSNSQWVIESTGQNLDGGALGTIAVDIMEKGTK